MEKNRKNIRAKMKERVLRLQRQKKIESGAFKYRGRAISGGTENGGLELVSRSSSLVPAHAPTREHTDLTRLIF